MQTTGTGFGWGMAAALFSLTVCVALGGPIASARSGDYPRTFKELDGKRLGILVGTTLTTSSRRNWTIPNPSITTIISSWSATCWTASWTPSWAIIPC